MAVERIEFTWHKGCNCFISRPGGFTGENTVEKAILFETHDNLKYICIHQIDKA